MFNLTREYRDILQVYKMVYVNARRPHRSSFWLLFMCVSNQVKTAPEQVAASVQARQYLRAARLLNSAAQILRNRAFTASFPSENTGV